MIDQALTDFLFPTNSHDRENKQRQKGYMKTWVLVIHMNTKKLKRQNPLTRDVSCCTKNYQFA